MFYFNLLVIFLVDFHVYFGLLLSKRAHLKGSSEKKGTSTENFGGREGEGGQTPPLHPLLRRGCIISLQFSENVFHWSKFKSRSSVT